MTDDELQAGLELLLDRPVLESELAAARRMDDAGTPLDRIARTLGPRVPQASDEELETVRVEPAGRDGVRRLP